MKTDKNVAVIGTIYALLVYLLHSTDEDLKNGCIFFNASYSAIGRKLPNCYLISNNELKKDSAFYRLSALIWAFFLRLKRATVWRQHFQGAKIYAQDHFTYSAALIGGDDYILISDGFNDFNYYMKTQMHLEKEAWCTQLSFKKKFIRFFCGSVWNCWFGLSPQCKGLLHENPVQIPYAKQKLDLLKVDFISAWKNASEAKKNLICSAFDVSPAILKNLYRCSVLLLAQNFECTDDIPEDELVAVYKKALTPFDLKKVMIKTHPAGRLNYHKYFPESLVLDQPIPMQLLVLLGVENIKTVVTIDSTAVSMFSQDVEIIWLGEGCHPVLERRYGIIPMEEVVFRSKTT